MEYRVDQMNNVSVLKIAGRLDATNHEEMLAALMDMIDKGALNLVVDLSALNYISSAGIRIFIIALKKLKPLGGELVFSALTEMVRKIFKMAGFEIMFTLFESQDEAVYHLRNKK